MPCKPGGTQIFVVIIDALLGGVVGQMVQQMANIVQQCSHDLGRVQPCIAGKQGRLQSMFDLTDRLATIL